MAARSDVKNITEVSHLSISNLQPLPVQHKGTDVYKAFIKETIVNCTILNFKQVSQNFPSPVEKHDSSSVRCMQEIMGFLWRLQMQSFVWIWGMIYYSNNININNNIVNNNNNNSVSVWETVYMPAFLPGLRVTVNNHCVNFLMQWFAFITLS